MGNFVISKERIGIFHFYFPTWFKVVKECKNVTCIGHLLSSMENKVLKILKDEHLSETHVDDN